MAGLKITLAVCLAVASMTNAFPSDAFGENETKPVVISEQWLMAHGCPKKGPFKADCNFCACEEAFSKSPACTLMACYSRNIDNWSEDVEFKCQEGEKFFSGCSRCTCDASGKNAVCDDSACEYYKNEATTVADAL